MLFPSEEYFQASQQETDGGISDCLILSDAPRCWNRTGRPTVPQMSCCRQSCDMRAILMSPVFTAEADTHTNTHTDYRTTGGLYNSALTDELQYLSCVQIAQSDIYSSQWCDFGPRNSL